MSKLARTTRAHLLFIITGEKLHPVHHRRLQHRSAVEFCIEWFGTEHLKFKVHSLITLILTSLRTRNIHSSNYLTEPSSHVRNSLAQSVLPVNQLTIPHRASIIGLRVSPIRAARRRACLASTVLDRTSAILIATATKKRLHATNS